jgi:hypothetical protein
MLPALAVQVMAVL